ncbi:sodium- and chloride-dependent glycine transporter 1-like [Ptychodera flava]|uniref:sodium- and chloride-dependent glycine transporter 1-like n=1 Tax=Ptychodera flava TaxID=63121 RepID=UPI00396AA44D
MCWAVFYLFATFSDLPSLPWVGCNHIWNTENCYDDRDINATLPGNDTNITVASASEEYFSIYVLKESSGIDDTGSLRWHLTLCLLLAWTLGFLALVRGVKSIGKVVYFTAIFPYVVLIILFFRGVTLPGAGEGIKFYMKADWSVLWNARVWKDAAAQIFFSLSAANGGLHVVSSYNKFSNNVYMDAMIIPLLNCGTSIFAGFAIFSTLGFMAHETGKDVSEVAASGVGLAFIAYPEALSRMPGAPFWAFLFFIMLITLGLGSLLVLVETIVTSIRDEFPIVNKWIKGHTWLLPFVICLVLFILGLPHVTEAGLYWLALQDAYAAAISMLILGLTELIVITYIYGYRNLLRNLKEMIGEGTRTFNYILYGITVIPMFIAPFLVLFVLIYYIYDYKPLEVGTYTYPYWAEPILGWLMTFGSIGLIVLYMPYHLIFKEKGSFIVRLKNSLKPRKDWGPLKEENRTMQNTHHGEEIIECVDDVPPSYRLPQVNPSDEVPEVIVHGDGLVVNHREQSTLKGKNAANEDSDPDTETNV